MSKRGRGEERRIRSNLLLQPEKKPMVVENEGCMKTEEIDGGVNMTGLQRASDLADDQPGMVRGRRKGGRGRRRGGRKGIFNQVL